MMASDYTNRLREEMQQMVSVSSDFIDQCCVYAEQLVSQNLPVFFDGGHVRAVLRLPGININHYKKFCIPKKSGGVRYVLAPGRPLKTRQRWILDNILSTQDISPHAQGFCSNRSIVTNTTKHIGYMYTFCVDIQDFFSSITAEQVETAFRNLGYSRSAAQTLTSLCCYDGTLPQGAPTSPCLSNIIFRELDTKIAAWTAGFHAVYTRYADDITISANENIFHLLPVLHQILHTAGFSLNPLKTRCFEAGKPKRITGLIVQDGVRIPKRFKRKLRQEIYFCKKFGVSAHLRNVEAEKRIHFKERLYGKAYYVKMVEPEIGIRFLMDLSQIEWPE